MIKHFTILAAALSLGACSTVHSNLPTPTRTIVVSISPEFLDPNKCPWPDPDTYIVTGTNVEVGEWIVAGKNAYTCEHLTRMKIKEQNDSQKAPVK